MTPKSRVSVDPFALLDQVADRPQGMTIGKRLADLSRHYGVSDSTIRRLYYTARKALEDGIAHDEGLIPGPPAAPGALAATPVTAAGTLPAASSALPEAVSSMIPPVVAGGPISTATVAREEVWDMATAPALVERQLWDQEARTRLDDLARTLAAASVALAELPRLRADNQRLATENARLQERVEYLSEEVLRAREGQPSTEPGPYAPTRKALDTNVIIDGRIVSLAGGGFLEGTIIVPGFILNEMKYLADSRDPARRTAGRRGLDNLRLLQEQSRIPVVTWEDEEQPGRDLNVDNRLLRFVQRLEATLVTNDHNLCRVAEIQGVDFIDINALYRAAKPVVSPFEEISLNIVEEGKKPEQGVGYLEDGTMIVVDDAQRLIGQRASVIVTQILPTTWGTIAFAKLKPTPGAPVAAGATSAPAAYQVQQPPYERQQQSLGR